MCTTVNVNNKIIMSSRKKSTSTTDSSSASSSGSSSTSSSSASNSGSSSSDSDSTSTSQEVPPRTNPIGTNSQTVKQTDKNIRRRSSENKPTTSTATTKLPVKNDSEKNGPTKIKEKILASSTKPTQVKASKNNIMYSSDDDSQPPTNSQSVKQSTNKTAQKNTNNNHNDSGNNKRKATAVLLKNKSSNNNNNNSTSNNNNNHNNSNNNNNNSLSNNNNNNSSNSNNNNTNMGGKGKAPPSIVKQSKLTNNKHSSNNSGNISNKVNHNQKQASSNSSSVEKSIPSGQSKLKKKSIFSPDNSSDDDSDDDIMPVQHKNTKIISVTKAISGSTKLGAAAARKNNTTLTSANNTVTKPKPKIIEKEKIIPKSSESSATSSSSTESTSSSDSETDSSADSSPPTTTVTAKKGSLPKKTSQKPSNTAKTDTSKDNVGSESDIEMKPTTASVVRKLTRSSSTRKSRHLTGKAASETDSDAESIKRSLSKSPVKKAPVATKGKAKNKRTETKSTIESNVKTPPTIPEERKCPIVTCDSVGHLGGQSDKHFTIEACPLYHNMSLTETQEYLHERKRREDEKRKLASGISDPSKKIIDQRQYLQKIKDNRAKFKPCLVSQNLNKADKEKEPSLNGIVCDYDLQLFREAQAIASENIENELKGLPSTKGTKYISMGKFCMEVWYQSPYPEDAARLPKLYICEFCLRYQKSEVGMKRHSAKCVWRHPPGDEIYRKGKLGVWQVDGKRHKQYCQHLCLLAKFFLDHKTLYYDVEPFLFYVMTLADSEGSHTVGYFSKEKNSFLNYNVSCILTLPPYQRKGYGRLLIDFSYLLTRVEGKIGSPEKPLSDLGLISYRSYWKDVLLDYLCSRTGTTLSIKDVSQEMAINSYDIVSTLQALGMMKYWKGKHIILKKQDVLEEYAERVKRRGTVIKIDRSCLRWTPFVPPVQTGPS